MRELVPSKQGAAPPSGDDGLAPAPLLTPCPVPIYRPETIDVWRGRGGGRTGPRVRGRERKNVHAKDQRARTLCEHFDFEPSPSDPLHLFVLLKDVRSMFRRKAT